MSADLRLDDEVHVAPVEGDGNDDPNRNAQEREPQLPQVETVEVYVHEREGLEEGVVDAVGEGDVDGREGDARV